MLGGAGGSTMNEIVDCEVLTPSDYFVINLQWTALGAGFFVYLSVALDSCHCHNTGGVASGRCTATCLQRSCSFWESERARLPLSATNFLAGILTLTSYALQTYEYSTSHSQSSSFSSASYNSFSWALCVLDTVIDAQAICSAVFYIAIWRSQRKAVTRLLEGPVLCLVLGSISNLVYNVQVFAALPTPGDTLHSRPDVYPEPFTLTFLRIIPVVTLLNQIGPRIMPTGWHWNLVALLLQGVSIVVVVAGAMMTVEHIGDPVEWDPEYDEDWHIFKSVWFVVVTSSTVGYGDFTTSTVLGRCLTVGVIMTGTILFVTHTGALWEMLSEEREGAGLVADVANGDFVVFAGDLDLHKIQCWAHHLFTWDSGKLSRTTLVILTEAAPGREVMEWIYKQQHEVQARIYFVLGDAFSEHDQRRAAIYDGSSSSRCRAIFLGGLSSAMAGDSANIMRLRHLADANKSRTFVNLYASPRSMNQVLVQRVREDHVVALDRLTWGILAANSDSPGTIACLQCLCSPPSSSDILGNSIGSSKQDDEEQANGTMAFASEKLCRNHNMLTTVHLSERITPCRGLTYSLYSLCD